MASDSAGATRRLFIAVMLPTAVQERLAGLIGLLDTHRAILRPTRPEGLHFTLRFLGNMTAAQEQQIVEAVAALRTRGRTCSPRACSRATRWRPTKPVAPVTRIMCASPQ